VICCGGAPWLVSRGGIVGLGRSNIGVTLFFLRFGGGFSLRFQLVGQGFEGFLAGLLLGGAASGKGECGNQAGQSGETGFHDTGKLSFKTLAPKTMG
jgi:hypothetical protein